MLLRVCTCEYVCVCVSEFIHKSVMAGLMSHTTTMLVSAVVKALQMQRYRCTDSYFSVMKNV